MRFSRLCLQAALVAITLLAAPCHAQSVTPTDAENVARPAALPPAQAVVGQQNARAALEVLRNDAERAKLIAVLEAVAAQPSPVESPSAVAPPAPPVTAPPPAAPAAEPIVLAPNSVGVALLVGLSEEVSLLRDKAEQVIQAVTDFPLLWHWIGRVASDAQTQAAILAAAWRLALVMAVGIVVESLARRALRRPMLALHRRAPTSPHDDVPEEFLGLAEAEEGQSEPVRRRDSLLLLLRRLPYLLAGFVLDLLPSLALAASAAGMLAAGLAATLVPRLVIITVVNAYVGWRAVVAVARAVVSPGLPRLRLVRLDTPSARAVVREFARLAAVAIGGYAVAEDALLFGLYKAAHDALLKLVALAVLILFARLVLRMRRRVKQALRAPEGSSGVFATLRNAVAGGWHRIVLFYLAALWLVWALDIANGFDRLLHFMLALLVVAVAVRAVDVAARIGFERLLAASEGLDDTYPGIEARISAYHGAARAMVNLLLGGAASFGVLLAAGIDAFAWFSPQSLGGRAISAGGDIVIALLIALFVWEFANISIERHLAQLTRSAQLSRSARLRTLLPMLRTALFVTVSLVCALVVLSEIGVNIAPLLAGAGVVGLAIGFGSQKLVQDIITGLFLLLENAMQVGDVVTLGGMSGTVENLSIRTIRLRALDGSVHIVPFSAVTTVTNMTRDYSFAVIDVSLGVNEESDHIGDLLRAIAAEMRAEAPWRGMVLADLEVLGIDKFTELHYIIRSRIKTMPTSRWAVARELNRRIKHRFDELAIESPMTSYRALGLASPPPPSILLRDEQ